MTIKLGSLLRPWHLGHGRFLKVDPAMSDQDNDLEYFAKHLWIVGSPRTVVDRIQRLLFGEALPRRSGPAPAELAR